MSTPITVLSPIGGQLISSFGGVLGFLPFQNIACKTYANQLPPTVNCNLMDCKRWELQLINFEDDTTHTGSAGGQGTDAACQGFQLSADIIWDLRNPPDLITRNGGNIVINPNVNPVSNGSTFNAGFQLWAYIGDDANYPTNMGAQYYYAPSAKMRRQVPVIDPNTKKMVMIHVEIIGNSRIFKLPAEQAQFMYYMGVLATRNFAC